MPELPEVETVKRGLAKLLPGHIILNVQYDTEKSFSNAKADIDEFLIGARIVLVERRAKVLLIELSTKYSLIIHLKMTGQLVYRSDKGKRFGAGHPNDSLVGDLPDKSTRVMFCLGAGKGAALEPSARKQRSTEGDVQVVHQVSPGVADTAIGQERWQGFGFSPRAGQCVAHLFFNDQRKFGWVRLIPTAEVPMIDFMKKLGPEPLSDDFNAKQFFERLQRRKNSTIKAALLDQTVIAGVGNIYADESLFATKIHPETRVKELSSGTIERLLHELRSVLIVSLEKGGSTDRNYVDAEGKRGSYLSFAQVFRREGKPCPRCKHEIIKLRVAGRGTHVCPNCQKQ